MTSTLEQGKANVEETMEHVLEHPDQIPRKHHPLIAFLGKLGFTTKGLMYGLIGGLACKSAFDHRSRNDSPQGVFILIGSEPGGRGIVYLILVLTGLLFYVAWRLAEGLTGQGYDRTFSRKKNFFKYRVSPLVSGLVYLSYAYYVIQLLRRPRTPRYSTTSSAGSGGCFPLCWRQTAIGTVGLVVIAIAFTAATITQLIPAVKVDFLNEMNKEKLQRNKAIRVVFTTTGRLGFFGRALLFLAVAYFFWRVVVGGDPALNPEHATVSQALNSFASASYAPYFLFIIGALLLLYAVYALSCVYFRVFPTPPPVSGKA